MKRKTGEIYALAVEIQGLETQAIRLALETGGLLAKGLKALATAGKSRELESWVKSLGLSRRTAFNRMGAYKAFRDTDNETLAHYELSALYELGQRTVAPGAIKEAMARARRGDKITREIALELMGKFKGK